MKSKLLKVLSLTTVALVLASCGKGNDKFTECNIVDTFGWDTTTAAPVNEGKEYRFKDLIVSGKYGNVVVIYESLSDYITDMKAIEVILSDEDAAKVNIRDTVTVSGKLSSKNGRYQLIDAKLEKVETKSKEESPLYYIPSQIVTREYFDGLFDKTWSGVLCETTLEVAALPEQRITANGTDAVITAVFPGEDGTISDENYNLIDVVIHHDISQSALNYANASIFGGTIGTQEVPALKVGDQFTIFGSLWFDRYLKFSLDELGSKYIEKVIIEEHETELSNAIEENWAEGSNYTDTVNAIYKQYANTGTMDNPIKADSVTTENTSSYILKTTKDAYLQDFGEQGANLYVNTEQGVTVYTSSEPEEGKDYDWTLLTSVEGIKYDSVSPTFGLLKKYSKQFKYDEANKCYVPTNVAIKNMLAELIGCTYFGYDDETGEFNAPNLLAYAITYNAGTMSFGAVFGGWYYTDSSQSAVVYQEFTIIHTLTNLGKTTITLPE